MAPLVESTIRQLNGFWAGVDRTRRVRLVLLVVLTAAFIMGLFLLLGRKEYVTLYRGLNPADAGEILQKLTEMNIDAKPVGSDTILIRKDQEPGVRMQLSSQGYPKSGLNYDLFMNGVGFGTTDYEKRRYFQFQLQDRLQEAIRTLDGVESAIVTISLPDEDAFVFRNDQKPATASVVLNLSPGYQMTPRQVQGIEALVSKSIVGLVPENISIIDTNMTLLNRPQGQDSELAGSQWELENQVRTRLERQIVSLLEPVFGHQGVMAAVHVTLDFDKHLTEIVRFEPIGDEDGIVVSLSELRERMQGAEGGGVPGVDSNDDIPVYPGGADSAQNYERISRTVNYEINQIREQIEKARGQIQDLSVSVLINSPALEAADMEKVQTLVAGATGLDAGYIVVQHMPFTAANLLQEQLEEALSRKPSVFTPALIRDLVLYGLLALAALFLLLLMYRFFSNVSLGTAAITTAMVQETAAADGGIAQIDLDEGPPTVQTQIEKLAKQRPAEVAQLLRTWLSED